MGQPIIPVMLILLLVRHSNSCLSSSRTQMRSPRTVYCKDISIYGSDGDPRRALDRLRGCDVVEGHLRLHMLELPHNFTLPNLMLVTDYLVLHRVAGLQSLAEFVPRLTAIRGRDTFKGYSFVLLSNEDLMEIGPWSLSAIVKGFVRIESNVLLCPGQPKDWEKLTRTKNSTTFINNHDFCPFDVCEYGYCSAARPFCENTEKGCTWKKGLKGCHRQCIGGCTSPGDPSQCAACKKKQSGTVCVDRCGEELEVVL